MKKSITRHGKTITAEVYYEVQCKYGTESVHVDKKNFNQIKGELFGIEPSQKTYDEANTWADNVINLHLKNS